MSTQYLIFLVICLINVFLSNQSIVLHIGALFNTNYSLLNNGQRDLQAAELAIEEINLRTKELFNEEYILRLLSNNTQCNPIQAVDAFFHTIFRRPRILFLVGTSCSIETKAVIQVADYYNLILFTHSTTFVSQVNQSYSTMVQLSVSDENYNDARVAFIKYNNWSHVAMIHQDSIEHSLMMAQLAKRLNQSNINVLLSQSASRFNLTSALHTLQEKKARIVFINFDTLTRPLFFCEVYRTFTYELRERYVWILTENDFQLWNFSTTNCTKEEILRTMNRLFIIDSSFERKPCLINPNITEDQLQERLQSKEQLNRQTLHAYDAIWVIALLIRASIDRKISLNKFTYSSNDIRDQWLILLEEIYFLGVSGPVSFQNGQRRAKTIIKQYQYESNRATIRIVAEYSYLSGLLTNCSECQSLIWPNIIPVDTERNVIRQVVLNVTEITLITIACLLGLAVAISFLTFNILYRHERYIKLSSPKLNNVMVIGAMHIHIAILLFALDQWFLQYNYLGHICMLRIFLFAGGFSLTFGSMFLKTLRVYRIFTSHDRPLLHSKLLQDHYLLLICLYLYTIDVLYVCLWHVFDPHFIDFTYETAKRLNTDITISNKIYFCDSNYRQKILPFIYFYKSLFLIIGGYLAAKTRHIHISALNDSKFIVWSIYIVVLTSLFTFIVMISIQNLRTYVVLSFVVIIMTDVIICLVFVPKVFELNNPHRNDIVSKDLYMDDSRTRRLAGEISYFEVYRYAQLQNRELKTELVRLNHTINNLQQKLEALSSNVTMALFPLAVRLASTFLHKPDLHTPNSRLSSKTSMEVNTISKEEEPHSATIEKECPSLDQTITTTTTSSDNLYYEFEKTLSFSSELNLSNLTPIFDESSSLSLTIEETSQSLTPIQSPSDNESVLYLRLIDELKIVEAVLESDLECIEEIIHPEK